MSKIGKVFEFIFWNVIGMFMVLALILYTELYSKPRGLGTQLPNISWSVALILVMVVLFGIVLVLQIL